MKNEYIFNAFTASAIAEIVNNELAKTKLRIRVTSLRRHEDGLYAVFNTNTKKLIVVQAVTNYGQSKVSIRAIHRMRDNFRSFTYLPNGQPGRNLENLIFNAEQGEVHSVSKEEYEKYLRSMLNPEVKDSYINERISWEYPESNSNAA